MTRIFVSRLQRRRRLPAPKSAELQEDNRILDHGPQRPDQPRQVRDEVLPVGGVEQDPRAVGSIAQQTQYKKQQTEPLARALALVLDDLRNARAEAGVEAGSWLATEVVVPQALGATFEALRPAIERLARARPLDRRLTREALGEGRASTDGALTVISGELEALAHELESSTR